MKAILLFVGVAAIVITFNNCGTGFDSFDGGLSASSLRDRLLSSDSNPNASLESVLMHTAEPQSVSASTSTAGQQSACDIHGDLQLRTHYKAGTGPELGGIDAPSTWNPYAEQEIASGKRFVLYYNDIIPDHNHYVADRYDSRIYPEEEVRTALRTLCGQHSTSVRFIQLDKEVTSAEVLSSVIQTNSPDFQVIHGLVYRTNLFTVVVPPMWHRSKSYVSLINGFYSLNQNLVDLEGPRLFQTLRESYAQDQQGAIGILWNGGGASASRTTNNKAYGDFNDFIKLIGPALNLNLDKAITFGGSRGGVTALNIASHPAIDQLRVALAFAVVPPSDLDLIATLVSPTMPHLLTASDWSTGYIGSWQKDFVAPDGVSTGQQQHLKVITGSSDSSYLKQNINLTAPNKIRKLRDNNTSVFLELGSHDIIVPFVDQYLLYQTYKKNDVRVEAKINYLRGHGGYAEPLDSALLNAVLRLNQSSHPRFEAFVNKGKKSNYKAVEGKNSATAWDLSYTDSPLTIQFPKLVIDQSPAQILATGVPGKDYVIVARDPVGKLHVHRFTLDENGISVSEFDPNSLPDGPTKVLRVFELDENLQLKRRIKFRSNVKGNSDIEVLRYSGTSSINPVRLGRSFPDVILEYIHGPNCANCYGPELSMGYGLLELDQEAPTQEERNVFGQLITGATPGAEPAHASCQASGSLESYSLTSKMNVASPHKNLQGHYFIGAKLTNGEWRLYSRGQWYKYEGNPSLAVPARSGALSPYSPQIFKNEDLSEFPKAEIYVGYGVGTSIRSAFLNMEAHKNEQMKMCQRLPSKPAPRPTPTRTPAAEPASVSCSPRGSLNSFSLTMSMKASSEHLGQPGHYFIGAHLSNGDWLLYSGDQWHNFNETPQNARSARSGSLSSYSLNLFRSEDLSLYPGAKIYAAYGVGTSVASAFRQMKSNETEQMGLCTTLPR